MDNLRGDRPDEVAAISTMVFPLVDFAVGLVILYYMFGIGWLGWYGGTESISGGYFWLPLAVLALCVYSIIRWGLRSESYCDRKRWAALILTSVLLILFGAWWIYSLGLFIAVTGLALLIYSSARLAATYE